MQHQKLFHRQIQPVNLKGKQLRRKGITCQRREIKESCGHQVQAARLQGQDREAGIVYYAIVSLLHLIFFFFKNESKKSGTSLAVCVCRTVQGNETCAIGLLVRMDLPFSLTTLGIEPLGSDMVNMAHC